MSATILVVDDDPDILSLVRYALEKDGYTVEEAASGAAALKKFGLEAPALSGSGEQRPSEDASNFPNDVGSIRPNLRRPEDLDGALPRAPAQGGPDAPKELPELAILDIMMPSIDGYTVCKRLLENEATRRIPLVILTAKSRTKDIFQTLPNVAAFFEKPFDPDTLRRTVASLVGKQ
ncbi:MAG: response regulator [Elusimicrobia bacterium]|nr:response regulator [Elusimicrobiota bacterium]